MAALFFSSFPLYLKTFVAHSALKRRETNIFGEIIIITFIYLHPVSLLGFYDTEKGKRNSFSFPCFLVAIASSCIDERRDLPVLHETLEFLKHNRNRGTVLRVSIPACLEKRTNRANRATWKIGHFILVDCADDLIGSEALEGRLV